jgi:hypothetical protein
MHGKVLEKAKYYVRTATGTSTQSYSHSAEQPVYGTEQGAAHSPIVWAIISSILFKIYTESSVGAKIKSQDAQEKQFSINSFMDDTIIFTTNNQSEGKLFQAANEDAQRWADILFASGGNSS